MPHATVTPHQRTRAKQLRKAMTPAETLLWRYVKANRIDGLSFRRQVPFRKYIADFCCMSARLIIELDGFSHDNAGQIEADELRDAFFAAQGFRVVRFADRDVLLNLEGIVESIREAARVAPPSPAFPRKRERGPTVRTEKTKP